VAKLEAFHIASVAHQSSYKFASKANGDGFIQKPADSADGQLCLATLEVCHIASVAHQSSYKLGSKANGDVPNQKSANSAVGQLHMAKFKHLTKQVWHINQGAKVDLKPMVTSTSNNE